VKDKTQYQRKWNKPGEHTEYTGGLNRITGKVGVTIMDGVKESPSSIFDSNFGTFNAGFDGICVPYKPLL
jgi:hypothetical protein